MTATIITNWITPVPAGLQQAIQVAGLSLWSDADGTLMCNDSDLDAVEALITGYTASPAYVQFLQQQQFAALQAQYESLIAANFLVSISGTTYTLGLDSVSLQHFDSEALAASIVLNSTPGALPWDATDYWIAADGVTQVPMTSAAQALTTANAIHNYVKTSIKYAAALTASIMSATDAASVIAIDVTQGWPPNSA